MFVSFQWFWVQSFGFLSPEAVKFQPPRGATLWALRSQRHVYTLNKHRHFLLDWKTQQSLSNHCSDRGTRCISHRTVRVSATIGNDQGNANARGGSLCDFLSWAKGRDDVFSMCVYLKECANIWEFPNGSEFLGRCLLKKKINLHLYFSSVGRQLLLFFLLFSSN